MTTPADARKVASRHAFSVGLFGIASALGAATLAYPFLMPALGFSAPGQAADGALVTALLLALCVLGMLVEAQGSALGARGIALLGALVALNSALRFVENALPGPGEFSPVFALILLSGYVFGARFGFLAGALTLLVSAILTAGLGPWLPYQMFVSGWVGMTAGWLPGRQATRPSRGQLVMLAALGVGWGFAYGALLNLSFWYALAGDPSVSWAPGLGIQDALVRYAAFYSLTSFVPDLFRALGNAVLVVVFGPPTLRALWRARRQMTFAREAR